MHNADTSVRSISSANPAAISNATNISSLSTRFARSPAFVCRLTSVIVVYHKDSTRVAHARHDGERLVIGLKFDARDVLRRISSQPLGGSEVHIERPAVSGSVQEGLVHVDSGQGELQSRGAERETGEGRVWRATVRVGELLGQGRLLPPKGSVASLTFAPSSVAWPRAKSGLPSEQSREENAPQVETTGSEPRNTAAPVAVL